MLAKVLTMKNLALSLTATLCLCAGIATAEAPVIVDAEAQRSGMGWRFIVTVKHNDTGWDHYADGWEVLSDDGEVLGFRELMHPHVNEQPFTRSLGDVTVPDGTRFVYIRAKCSVDGWTGEKVKVDLYR